MKFEYEEFSTIEEFFLYLVSVAPYMKQVLPASSYKGYVFSMVYAKGNMDPGLVEFDISTKKYKTVSSVERADKNYFIILKPKIATIADSAIKEIESLGKK